MTGQAFNIRTSKFITNPLLQRKQFIVEVSHPGRPNVSKEDLTQKLMSMYKVSDPKTIILFGFKTQFGGGHSTGFGLIYDSIDAAKDVEPAYRLARQGLGEHKKLGRKGRKEKKNRLKKVRGIKRAGGGAAK